MEPTELSMLELGKKLGSGELSSVEAVRACLSRVDRFDGQVKAFLKVDREGALAQDALDPDAQLVSGGQAIDVGVGLAEAGQGDLVHPVLGFGQ